MAVNIDHKLTLLANLPLRPSMATRKNGHKKLPPGLIDRWLRTNSRRPTVAFLQDYLFLKNVATEHVICLVERECVAAPDDGTIFEDPPTYTLYITACLPRGAKCHMLLWQSPRAILEKYVGFNNDRDAPEWTRWAQSTREFQQPKASFADLFVRMAVWDENKLQPGLPFRMSQWARSILIETRVLAKSAAFRPTTPRKVRPPIKNARSHKRHSARYTAQSDDSHTPSKRNGTSSRGFNSTETEEADGVLLLAMESEEN